MQDYQNRLSPGRHWAWLLLLARTLESEGPGPFSHRGVKGRELATCQQIQRAAIEKLRGTDPGCHPSLRYWEPPRNAALENPVFRLQLVLVCWCNELPQLSPTNRGQTVGTRAFSTAGAYVPVPSG